jgi:phage terminase small subunit
MAQTTGGLTGKRAAFVAYYCGQAKQNATEAARLAGFKQPGSYGHDLLKIPEIAAAIEAFRAEIKTQGIAHQQNRVSSYNHRWTLLEQVRAERAADPWLSDVPGGTTGLVVKQLKTVKHQYLPDPDDEDGKASQALIETWESAVDTGLLREWRELEKQAAQDVGDWTERKEVTGKDGGPMEITEVEVVRTVAAEVA